MAESVDIIDFQGENEENVSFVPPSSIVPNTSTSGIPRRTRSIFNNSGKSFTGSVNTMKDPLNFDFESTINALDFASAALHASSRNGKDLKRVAAVKEPIFNGHKEFKIDSVIETLQTSSFATVSKHIHVELETHQENLRGTFPIEPLSGKSDGTAATGKCHVCVCVCACVYVCCVLV